ncbi:iron-sulfur cluster assembly protein [Trujillonella humicola]|uniref:iron-sulfur cluster assembly protein n=1 Tax=Trujillonella humicola TaxID=3383699 RepID=UPI00390695DB
MTRAPGSARPGAAPEDREAAIAAALASVDDPCSIAAQAPMSIGDLGLVRDWRVDGGVVTVTVSPTAPSCVLMGSIAQAIEERVGAVEGVDSVHVELDTHTIWSPELMSDGGRQRLAERRRTSLLSVPVRPRQWEAAGARAGEGGWVAVIRNVVVGRLLDDVDPGEVERGLQALRELRVEGVGVVLAGLDLGLRDGNADFVVTADIEDEAAYRRYDEDPEHNRIRREVFGRLCSRIERVQFRLPG